MVAKHIGDGPNVFIGYGGYAIDLASSEAWVRELYLTTLRERGVRFETLTVALAEKDAEALERSRAATLEERATVPPGEFRPSTPDGLSASLSGCGRGRNPAAAPDQRLPFGVAGIAGFTGCGRIQQAPRVHSSATADTITRLAGNSSGFDVILRMRDEVADHFCVVDGTVLGHVRTRVGDCARGRYPFREPCMMPCLANHFRLRPGAFRCGP